MPDGPDGGTEEGTDKDSASEGSCRRRPWEPGLLSLLCRLAADVMLIGVILSTVLGVVHNANQEVVRPAAAPRPFLPPAGRRLVPDYYRGDVFQAFADAGEYENAVFMYYAPWDRASQAARPHIVLLAEFFAATDLLVAAVNCWHPGSDCAREFGNKSLATPFPVIIFYPGRRGGVQYRGPLRADLLISWVRSCRYPITHLHSAEHLAALQVWQPSVLVGFLPLTAPSDPDPAHAALLAAALALLEAHPDRALGVAVTTEPALARALRLGPSNPVRLFTWNSSIAFPNKTVDSGRLVGWALRQDSQVAPWLRLPRRKSTVLQRSLGEHALLVFTARRGLAPASQAERAARSLAAAYRDCEASPAVATHRAALAGWHPAPGRQPPACHPLPANMTCQPGGGRCGRAGHDDMVWHLLREDRLERAAAASPEEGEGEWEAGIPELVGLGCRANRSLAVLLVDSALHGSLLTALGLPAGWEGAAILSPGEEAVYPGGEGSQTEAALGRLVAAWHRGVAAPRPGLRASAPAPAPEGEEPGISHLVELDSKSLRALVLGVASPGAVVLYTAPYCAHCTAASHALHTVQRLLRPLGPLGLHFYTVDATRNDLPVQLTALSYPTVLMFPEHRKASSRVFPVSEDLSPANLLTFIVSNLAPGTRLRLALSSCSLSCLARLRLAATAELGRLEAVARRRPAAASRRAFLRRRRYSRTVLYVVTAWAGALPAELPRVSDNFVRAILDSFQAWGTGS